MWLGCVAADHDILRVQIPISAFLPGIDSFLKNCETYMLILKNIDETYYV